MSYDMDMSVHRMCLDICLRRRRYFSKPFVCDTMLQYLVEQDRLSTFEIYFLKNILCRPDIFNYLCLFYY